MEALTNISCPKCGHEFKVEEVLAKEIEAKYRQELSDKITSMQEDYENKEAALREKETELKQQEKQIEQAVQTKLDERTKEQELEISKKLKSKYDDQIAQLNEETEAAKKEARDLKSVQIENERLKRSLNDQKQELELEYETKLNDQLKNERETIQKREEEKIGLRLREKEELIDSLKKQVDEMKRKAEQGSMQMQGEVQELVLEEMLKEFFPLDLIEEVPKGVKGADVIQTVRNSLGVDCGKIVFESKRTKSFSNAWINKLKTDAVSVKADILVIVSEAVPEGIDRIGNMDGVWVCTFQDFKGLVLVLRESLIRISEAFESQANKGDKMQMLYDYLLSNEFRMQVGEIIDGFTSLQESYHKEKRAMERIWKEREKQLERVLLNTNHFIGSIKGIAGSSIESLKLIGESDNILDVEEDVHQVESGDQ